MSFRKNGVLRMADNFLFEKMILRSCYPANLLSAIKGKCNLSLPIKLSQDVLSGIQYALSSLSEDERLLLQLRYAQEQTISEIASYFQSTEDEIENAETKVLQKLRHRSRWEYIQYGIEGLMKKRIAEARCKAYREGYHDGVKDASCGIVTVSAPESLRNLPITYLGLSSRAQNCLHRSGYSRIGDVVDMHTEEILRIRNLGTKTAEEIAGTLQQYGFLYSAWDTIDL